MRACCIRQLACEALDPEHPDPGLDCPAVSLSRTRVHSEQLSAEMQQQSHFVQAHLIAIMACYGKGARRSLSHRPTPLPLRWQHQQKQGPMLQCCGGGLRLRHLPHSHSQGLARKLGRLPGRNRAPLGRRQRGATSAGHLRCWTTSRRQQWSYPQDCRLGSMRAAADRNLPQARDTLRVQRNLQAILR